jgi:hypothetical protein
MRINKIIVIGALLALLLPSVLFAKSQAPEIPYVAPPKLVECKTEQTCDHDPKHLEEFVINFYEWYIKEHNKLSQPDWNTYTIPEREKDYNLEELETLWVKRGKLGDSKLKEMVISKLAAWIYIAPEYDNGKPAKYFCARDYDPILCQEYIPDSFKSKLTTKILNLDSHSVQILLFLPKAIYNGGNLKPTSLTNLSVWLETEDGAWKISRVREWPLKDGGL